MGDVFRVFDAAYPPEDAPPGAEGVLGYLGRVDQTPHIWTPDEWRRFEHLRQFPCWVPDLQASPWSEADNAVFAAERLGWARLPQPETRAIILDGEATAIRAWYEPWADRVLRAGYWPVDYGSLSAVLVNAAVDVWAADWNDLPAIIAGQTIDATQYKANIPWQGTQIDLSVVGRELFLRGGVGPRHG